MRPFPIDLQMNPSRQVPRKTAFLADQHTAHCFHLSIIPSVRRIGKKSARPLHHAPLHGHRLFTKTAAANAEPIPLAPRHSRKSSCRPFLERLIVGTARLRKTHKRVPHGTVDPRLKARHDLKAQVIAPSIRCIIRCIVAHFDVTRRTISNKLCLPQAEKRTHDIACTRPHARRAMQSRTPQNMQEHRFRLVVRMMRRSDGRSAERRLQAAQKTVAHIARRRLERKLRYPRIGRHIRRLHGAGNAARLAEGGNIASILARGLAPNTMLKMRRMKRKAQSLPQAQQDVEQSHRVRPA